jgi:hypothetical protein
VLFVGALDRLFRGLVARVIAAARPAAS